MSLYDYRVGQKIAREYGDDDFYGLIQGLMRLADTDNLEKLKATFPDIWSELSARYKAPGGRLISDGTEGAY